MEENELSPLERRLEALPEPLQERISGFEARNPLSFIRFGEFELQICEQAAAIAHAIKYSECFVWWWNLSLEDKLFYTLGLDPKISQYAIQEAANLAYALLKYPELIPKMHGSLCSLVGCAEYGCYAAPIGEETT